MWLATLAYELSMRCQKHNLTSPIATRAANNFLQVILQLEDSIHWAMLWPGNILLLLFKYFQLLSDTIYSMNSIKFKRNKPKLIQNRDRNYFLAITNVRPVKVETSNQAIFENGDKAFT